MSAALHFQPNDAPTLGVELELMLVDPASFDLATAATPVQRLAEDVGLGDRIKLEITQSMIEVNSSVHARHAALRDELQAIGRMLLRAAHAHGVRVCGGGTHPFHRWQERHVSPTERFQEVGQRYGYLAKQFTVFGQHIHVGCRSGDDAIEAIRRLSLYVPHFIALSASSTFHRGVDTTFDSCRLNMVAAFPTSGRMPELHSWRAFNEFYERLLRFGVVSSIKDFYWDIRPQPAFGTVELRVPDTPLEVPMAGDLAAYAQVLTVWTRPARPPDWLDDPVYRHNRFQAARYGFAGSVIVGVDGGRASVRDHLLETLDRVSATAAALGCTNALTRLARRAKAAFNDASWLREQHASTTSLSDVVERATGLWGESVA